MFRTISGILFLLFASLDIQAQGRIFHSASNPVIPGWYADPEGAILQQQLWIYPTYSAPYEQQVFLNAFSTKD